VQPIRTLDRDWSSLHPITAEHFPAIVVLSKLAVRRHLAAAARQNVLMVNTPPIMSLGAGHA